MINRSIFALMAGCMLAAGLLPGGALAAGDADIQAARQELHLRTETERRMRRDFESLLGNNQMSATEISEFENYLAGLGRMVDKQRRRYPAPRAVLGAGPGTAGHAGAGPGKARPPALRRVHHL
jgi:hypothetical protein